MARTIGGIKIKGRAMLAKVLKGAPETISVEIGAKLLGRPQAEAAKLMASWAKRGWLERVRRGLYIRVPIQSLTADVTPEEPKVVAEAIFSPCYIGGFSACEHWDFTEQVFNTIIVFTKKQKRKQSFKINGIDFLVKTVKAERFFGFKSIWAGTSKYNISDPTKTIIDCLNDPEIAGGIRMVEDFLKAYFNSKEKNETLLIEYANKMKNSAIYKRLGFLLEKNLPNELTLIKYCEENIKAGYSQLDPSSVGNAINTRWKLWIHVAKRKKRKHTNNCLR